MVRVAIVTFSKCADAVWIVELQVRFSTNKNLITISPQAVQMLASNGDTLAL